MEPNALLARMPVHPLVSGAALMLLLVADCTGPAAEPASRADCPEGPLLDAVREAETLRVIVRLELETRPEAELSEADAAEQRRRIASAQDALLADLADSGAEVTRRYERFAQLGLTVTEPALCLLLVSPRVRDVALDTDDRPGGAG